MDIDIPAEVIADVEPHFDETILERGLSVARSGRVVLVKPDPWPVVGRITGDGGFVVTVRQNGQSLAGDCSCDKASDCEHAAATALVALADDRRRRPDREMLARQQAVSEWLAQLGLGAQPSRSPRGSQVILYVLTRQGGRVGLTVHQSTRRRRGGYGRSATLVRLNDSHALPGWIPPDDARRIALLRAISPRGFGSFVFDIEGLDGEALADLASCGRLFWESPESPALALGPERTAPLRWTPSGDDEVALGIDAELEIVMARAPHYVDRRTNTVGPLDLGLSSGIAGALLGGPPVPRSMLRVVERSLAPLVPADAIPSPEDGLDPAEPDEPLQAILRVELAPTSHCGFQTAAIARYGEHRFELGAWDGTRPLSRDLVAEARLAARANAVLDSAERGDGSAAMQLSCLRELCQRVLPTLMSEGWTLECEDELPYDLPLIPEAWVERIQPSRDRIQWFEMELGVRLGGKTVPLLPLLLQAIRRGDLSADAHALAGTHLGSSGLNLELPDGSWVFVPGERLRRWLGPLLELRVGELDGDTLELPAYVAALMDDELGAFGTTEVLAEARRQLDSLVDLEPRRERKSFGTALRRYQREGLAWLRILHDAGYGGVLADDMGLGKTVQLLAFLEDLRVARSLVKGRPALVVAPLSVVGHWRAEAERFAPALKPHVHHGPDRDRRRAALDHSLLVVTSYQTLVRDLDHLVGIPWISVILDEAQALKNPSTQLHEAAAALKAGSRFAVTGTPVENHLGELWSLFDLVMPGLLGTRRTFDIVFRKPIERHGSTPAQELLRQRIRPFLLRRDKKTVALDLPDKIDIIERIELEPAQRDLYESMRLRLDDQVRAALHARGASAVSLTVLDALLKLRQVCCDPGLVDQESARSVKESAKLDRLLALLDELVAAGRSVLVFSQFVKMLDRIQARCARAGIPTLELTGKTRARDAVIQAFQRGDVPVFLISLKAGGAGLNLTRADTVILYDPWWNPAVESQAADRAHRIGQDKNVFVYRLVAADTLEERILDLQARKSERAEAALGGGGADVLASSDLEALYRELV